MSSSQRYGRRAIDEAIDRAIGDMMEIDPRPGLRRRVRSRIERSASSWALWSAGQKVLFGRGSFILLPAAAVLMIIVAVVATRWRESPVELAQTPAPAAPLAPTAPLAPAHAVPLAPAVPAAPRAAARRSEALFGPRRDRVSAASIDRTAPAPAFIETAPPVYEAGSLALAPIVMSPLLHIQELRIAPIDIQRITVPALPPPR